MKLFYLAVWHWRRWRLKREWISLCDQYDSVDCGAALSEYISTDLATRRRAFDERLEALKQFEADNL